MSDSSNDNLPEQDVNIQSDRLWRDDAWTARVIKNEDDDG
jgi:hypothetical protein